MAVVPSQQDTELGFVRDGYPALAAWIGRDPDHETFVFRKFNRLSARNLLHLQCQLIHLEDEIDKLDDKARKSSDFEACQASRRWEKLKELATNQARPEKARLDKAEELALKIKEYREYHGPTDVLVDIENSDEAILRQAQIAQLSGPRHRVLSTFREYLQGNAWRETGLPSVPIIGGRAKNMLNEADDLVALRKSIDEDLLSKLLQNHWAFQKRKTVDSLDRTTLYKGQYVAWTVAAISMLCATVLLVVAIVSLYIVDSSTAKLGMVTAYTVLFALSIALLTNARRAEIYGAAAAYAAVLVVFISGSLGSSQPEQCMVQLSNGYFKTINCPAQDGSFSHDFGK